ncbi:MarR family winged helix-turn-helix transcriptional regulator [Actinomadura scrupuli]|uniref:MarR family winged helix-turn-helix transcriptional regulator n=1 Tax=Actinomadura scrupuli TaxID=559629 RepID=UPI003D98E451
MAASSSWDSSPGFLLWHANLRWQRSITMALKPLGLTHVQFVLLASAYWLGRNAEPPSQRELADHAGTDAMMTSQVVRTLEGKGLIDRTADPADSRVKRLHVTQAGRTVALRAIEKVEAADRDYFRQVAHPDLLIPQLRSLALPGATARSRPAGASARRRPEGHGRDSTSAGP